MTQANETTVVSTKPAAKQAELDSEIEKAREGYAHDGVKGGISAMRYAALLTKKHGDTWPDIDLRRKAAKVTQDGRALQREQEQFVDAVARYKSAMAEDLKRPEPNPDAVYAQAMSAWAQVRIYARDVVAKLRDPVTGDLLTRDSNAGESEKTGAKKGTQTRQRHSLRDRVVAALQGVIKAVQAADGPDRDLVEAIKQVGVTLTVTLKAPLEAKNK